jgi:hypothetical protein
MNPLIIAGGLGAAALALAAGSKPEAPPPAKSAAPADQVAITKAGDSAPPVVVAAQPAAPTPSKVELPKSAGSVVGTVVAGIAVSNAVGNAVEKLAGEGAGDVARLNLVAATGIATKAITEKVLVKVGAPPEVAKHVGITTGAAVVIGAPAAIAIKGGAELISLGIKAVAGAKVESAVRGAVSELDPTKPGSLANKAVKPVSKVVKALGKIF